MKTLGHLCSGAVADSAGLGVRADRIIRQGETVAAFGGTVLTRDAFEQLSETDQRRSVQIAEDLFQAASPTTGTIAHSCAPNCGLQGATIVVAMRDILPGEELTIDHAMTDGSGFDEFECHCAAPSCRGKVTGNDWMLPELQLAYRGFFAPYLARRISSLVSAGASRRSAAL